MVEKNYDARLCCSKLNKKLISTICKDKYRRAKRLEKNVRITEDMILTSMIKNYAGYVSLEEFEDELNDKPHD